MASLAQAIRLALRHGETHLGVREIFGQDVGPPLGGVFTVTQGLERAWSSPLDERGILGTAAGLAMMGVRSVCEIQFADYLLNGIDLLRLIGNTCWSTRGQFPMPMVLMTPVGGGIHGGIYHSHSVESFFAHLPGWKVVMPSNAHDAYGLMVSAIEDGNPVAFLLPKALLYRAGPALPGEPADLAARINAPIGDRAGWKPVWPAIEPFRVPIGEAAVLRRGDRLTAVSWGRMLGIAMEATGEVEGIEWIDLRTLIPFDRETVLASAARTKRLLVVNEDGEQANLGEHLLRVATESVPGLRTRLVAAKNLPGVGLSAALEDYTLPTPATIRAAAAALLA